MKEEEEEEEEEEFEDAMDTSFSEVRNGAFEEETLENKRIHLLMMTTTNSRI